jgi:hypothetical protein
LQLSIRQDRLITEKPSFFPTWFPGNLTSGAGEAAMKKPTAKQLSEELQRLNKEIGDLSTSTVT